MATSKAVLRQPSKSSRPKTNKTDQSFITTFEQKDNYIGEKDSQIRNGFGVYNYDNSFFRYEGEWKNGKKHGHGKLILGDGSYYEGQFTNGEIDGNGLKYWAATGSQYSGQFYRGELHGKGELKYGDTSFYAGDWQRNIREGRGYFSDIDGQVYKGEFHKHKKHGTGKMTYKNGDVYEGDWVQNNKQGSGVMTLSDGSVYKGQFMNDLFNGQGVFKHISGIVYDGQWVNGAPEVETKKLVIVGIGEDMETENSEEISLELLQGERFSLSVECRTDTNELMHLEEGRLLKISAGFRNYASEKGNPVSVAAESGSLLDIIEDIEASPVETPFGYEIVPYPLTDDVLLKVSTNFGDNSVAQLPEESSEDMLASEAGNEEVSHSEMPDTSAELQPDSENDCLLDVADSQLEVENPVREETPPPSVVPPQRTVQGCAAWDNLLLPKPPALYRPFAILDEEADSFKDRDKKGGKKKTANKSEAREKEEPVTASKEAKNRYKKFGDERFARPEEYVIMVEDASEPAFMGKRLPAAFIKLQITAPRKEKKASVPKEKEKKKQWDTSRLIAHSMVHGPLAN